MALLLDASHETRGELSVSCYARLVWQTGIWSENKESANYRSKEENSTMSTREALTVLSCATPCSTADIFLQRCNNKGVAESHQPGSKMRRISKTKRAHERTCQREIPPARRQSFLRRWRQARRQTAFSTNIAAVHHEGQAFSPIILTVSRSYTSR